MTDVFVSYSRSDEAFAGRVADALRGAGYCVWRDDELPAHRSYSEVIEEYLTKAKAVVVLWSSEAAKSQWVRAEADSARNAGTLVQGSIDGTTPPLPFNQIQCADLKDWNGDKETAGWRKLHGSVVALAGVQGPGTAAKSNPRRRDLCICVLPFANMSGDAEQEYFSDGISEDITTDLSKISALGVVARNTAFTFKGKHVDVAGVAQTLGVSHVLEGSVRKVGDRVRINAQLIDGRSGEHLWAERYDRDLQDIFAIQDEISKAIVDALKVKLLPEEKKAIEQRGTTNVEAYKLYLLAREYWATGNHGDPKREERVMRICSRAVQIDSRYAQAWALLSIAQSSLYYGHGRSDLDDGFAAAHAALSIDSTVGEAYCAKARRLSEQERHDEAELEMSKALQVAPDSWDVHKEAGRMARLRPNGMPKAARHYRRAVDLMDSDFHAWGLLVTCSQNLGDSEAVQEGSKKMVSEALRALQQDPSNGAALGIIAGGYAILGERDRALEWIERAMLIDPDNLTMRYNFACILAGYVNDKEEALRLLENVLARSPMHFKMAQTDTDLDGLRDDPRFQKMIGGEVMRHRVTAPAARL
ncbi:MAG: TIR domain-containing protein [Sphingomicrobium sp.]